MADEMELGSAFGWAATLLLYSGDIGRHLKEFDGVFPGLGRKLPVEVKQFLFLGGERASHRAADTAQDPVQADAVMVGDGD